MEPHASARSLASDSVLNWSIANETESPEAFVDRTRAENPSVFVNQKEDASAYNNLGVALYRRSMLGHAEAALRRSVETDPQLGQAWVNLSILYYALDRRADSLAAATSAYRLLPGDKRAVEQYCMASLIAGNARDAVLCFKTLASLGQLDPVSKMNFAVALSRAGKHEDAEKHYSELILASPLDAAAHNGLGLSLYNRKKYEKAAQAFKRSTEIDPEYTPGRFNLALANLAMRNRAGALSQYKFLKETNEKLAGELYRLMYAGKVLFVGDKDRKR